MYILDIKYQFSGYLYIFNIFWQRLLKKKCIECIKLGLQLFAHILEHNLLNPKHYNMNIVKINLLLSHFVVNS